MAIGIDVGRNYVKARTTTGAQLTFPSVIGEFPNDDRLLLKRRDFMVEIDGRRRYLGEQAAAESRTPRPIGAAQKIHPDTVDAMLTVLGHFRLGGNPYITTGIPVDQFNVESKQALLKLIAGTHVVRVPYDTETGTVVTVDDANLRLIPEGAGAFWSTVLNDEGFAVNTDLLKRETVRVVDIGSMTCNILTIRLGDYISRESFTLRYGCYKLDPENSIRPVTAQELAESMHNDIAARLQDGLQDGDLILLAGGGALHMEGAFRERYSNVQVVPNPVEANAIGMARMGAGMERAEKQAGIVLGQR